MTVSQSSPKSINLAYPVVCDHFPSENKSIIFAERDVGKDFTRDPSLILGEVSYNLAKEFPEVFQDAVRHSDLLSLSWAPLMLRAPWAVITGPNHKGMVTVAGDAMHPMTPDLGQGGCTALEDAVVLARNIADAFSKEGTIISQKRVEEGMENYIKERRWRVAGLIVGSFLCGWVQQGGTGVSAWIVRFIRDHLFYKFFYPKAGEAVKYDCGELLPVTAKS